MSNPKALQATHDDETFRLTDATKLKGFGWRRHAIIGTRLLKCENVRQPASLQDIADDRAGIGDVLRGCLGLNRRARPDRKYLSGQPIKGAKNDAA